MRRLNMLIQREVDAINAAACWTDEQKRLFDHLLSDRYSDAGIMLEMNIASREKYYRLKKQVFEKIDRINAEQ